MSELDEVLTNAIARQVGAEEAIHMSRTEATSRVARCRWRTVQLAA